MTITRNGINYELTYEEMREAYETMRAHYLKEDILCKLEEMGIDFLDETINYIVQRVDKYLGNNDSYWESYWMTIENVIEENVEGN